MSQVESKESRPRVPHRIESERLVLRCYAPTDAQALQAASAGNREHLLPWLPWAEADPQSVDEKLELILGFRSNYDADRNSVMGIFDRQSGELVGGTGIHPCGGEGHRFTREIGYWIVKSREGHGFVTEAVRALLVVAFERVGLASLIIRCDPENTRSRKIPENLGFVTEGLLRNTIHRANGDLAAAYRYCMTAKEFRESSTGEAWSAGQLPIRIFDALDREIPPSEWGGPDGPRAD